MSLLYLAFVFRFRKPWIGSFDHGGMRVVGQELSSGNILRDQKADAGQGAASLFFIVFRV